ncbi:MAG: hypothetical protein RRY99_07995 [Flavobacterium sp.]
MALFKFDIGITNTKRDPYYNALILSANNEFEKKGIVLDLNLTEDVMLLSDYASWRYRKRTENVPLANNLKARIQNRKTAERCKGKWMM